MMKDDDTTSSNDCKNYFFLFFTFSELILHRNFENHFYKLLLVSGCGDVSVGFPGICTLMENSTFAVRKFNDNNWTNYESNCFEEYSGNGSKIINVSSTLIHHF